MLVGQWKGREEEVGKGQENREQARLSSALFFEERGRDGVWEEYGAR
jgi:hypothetical protein